MAPDVGKTPVKEQLVDAVPKKFKAMKFGVQAPQDIMNQGVLEVSDNMLYDVDRGRTTFPHGPLDPRLGTSSKTGKCGTCDLPLQECSGHFGHVRLPLPVFHIGYLRYIKMILENICKNCSRVLLTEEERRHFLKLLRRPGIDNMTRTKHLKSVNEQCRKVKECMYCGDIQGTVRKLSVLKLAHDKFVTYNKSTAAKKVIPSSKVTFDASFDNAKKNIPDLERHARKAMDDLNPLKVLNLFKAISPTDCELLGLNPAEGRPEMFIWQYVPAPPICIRPSVAQEGASTEDDITSKLAEIVLYCSYLRESLAHGATLQVIMEQWEFLQCQVAMYVNSDVPGLYQPGYGKPIRGFCQRLKGKQGRFRGNLSGKRVDFSGRTVISPDPNLSIDQVAVPQLVAKNMTYPERVYRGNMAKLRKCIERGPKVHPGAKTIIKKDSGFKINLEFANRDKAAQDLAVGDVVERHLEDGDVVLFNRQPSLHKLSIMSHRAKIRPWRTFRLNECVCTPYNADFDGDEMNLHVPQTEEARAEAINLMGVPHNLATPKNGEPIIAATQDFITAAYLLSSKDRFYNRKTFTYICMQMLAGEDIPLKLPPPAILKPEAMWTGKQIFSIMIRANDDSPVLLNLDAKCREYKAGGHGDHPPDMDPKDAWLVIRNSEVLCGRMDKSTVGGGKKDSVFYVLLRDWGPEHAVTAMNRLARLCARTLTLRGFTIGIGDVFPSDSVNQHKEELVEKAYRESDDLIEQFNSGKLEKATGCDMEQTLENKVSGILSKVRTSAGNYCVDNLSWNNAPLIMARSGSKGSDINVAQMVACVGQQIIGGSRVVDGFMDRTLPHFFKNARQPQSKGFVKNSFYTGLHPTEFIFHAMSGREGLVDTAVKTAETGYMSRRLMKSLEDLSTRYDDTVRTSGGDLVQFQFGADNLDPVDMEGSAVPVHFDRTWTHSENLAYAEDPEKANTGVGLLPNEVVEFCRQKLEAKRKSYTRKHLVTGEVMGYHDETDFGTDEFEGARAFLDTVEKYVQTRARDLARARKLAGLDPCAPKGGFWQLEKKDDTADRTMRWKEKILRKQNLDKDRAKVRKEKTAINQEQTAKEKAIKEEERRQKLARGEKVEPEPEPSKPKVEEKKPKPEPVFDDTIAYDESGQMEIDVDFEGQQAHMDRVARISQNTLARFINQCLDKYEKSKVEPGHAVGAVGAQSIGEPGTQMTLKTFHFAGVAGMSITQGVPRIKEIINASKTISTPVITCPLLNPHAIEAARVVKGRIEKTFIEDVMPYIEDEWQADVAKLNLKIDPQRLADMQLGITTHDIKEAILKAKKLKMKIDAGDIAVYPDKIEVMVRNSFVDTTAQKKMARLRSAAMEKGQTFIGAMDESSDLQLRVNFLKRVLPLVPISGYPDATRAIIQSSEDYKHTVLVEGYGFRACMTTEGVDGIFCKTNSVMECRDVLGIEAARTTIAHEITEVMKDMGIDPRHMQLLADVMTYKGEVLGITRFGLQKMRDSVLQLSSFERTSDHLFDAAANMKVDEISGVSECIIMGQTMTLGTGAFQMVRNLNIKDHEKEAKPTIFEDAWKKDDLERRKMKQMSRINGHSSATNLRLIAAAA